VTVVDTIAGKNTYVACTFGKDTTNTGDIAFTNTGAGQLTPHNSDQIYTITVQAPILNDDILKVHLNDAGNSTVSVLVSATDTTGTFIQRVSTLFENSNIYSTLANTATSTVT
jgi:hypothetical protein